MQLANKQKMEILPAERPYICRIKTTAKLIHCVLTYALLAPICLGVLGVYTYVYIKLVTASALVAALQ